MLNSIEWEYFKLEDLFEINYGRFIPSKYEHKPGDIYRTPYITTTENNNGIMRYMNLEPDYDFEAITIATDGSIGEAFYQNKPFLASNITAVLKPLNKFNKYIALFIITILKKEKYRYSYGRKWSINKVRSTMIKLPIDSNGDPNWKFMEDYMKSLSEGSLEEYSLPKNNIKLNLDDREWDEFKLEDLFEICSSPNTTSKIAKELIDSKDNNINYVTRTTYNNGVAFRLNKSKAEMKNICINNGKVIIVGAESTKSFYQEEDFITGNKISILKNIKLNNYNGIFISTLIDWEFYRYSYGRGLTAGRLKNTVIKLPIKPKASPDEKSEPDWKFMEDYIKGLPYTNKL